MRLLTPEEAAIWQGVSQSALWSWAKSGYIPAIWFSGRRDSRRVMFCRKAVERWTAWGA